MLLVLGTAGCSGAGSDSDPAVGASSATTGTETAGSETATEPIPPGPPVIADGPCPYLDETYVEETVGQRMARVETLTVEGQPAPDCVFYRPDETAAVSVDLTPYPDPVAAQNAALSLVTTAAMPITDLGDYGGVLVSPGRTLLAVTTGPLLVVVITNQESSLQAHEVAAAVLAALPSA